jgi:hypothetical protein
LNPLIPNIVQYFHDCYRSDNRELVLYDFLDKKVENRLSMEGKEVLINGEYPLIPINSDKATAILKKIEVFRKEKELLYGAFFVCGWYKNLKRETKKLCAPLFYYPAEITHKDDFHYLSIKLEERRLNLPLLSILSKEHAADFLNDPLYKQLPQDLIRFEDVRKIIGLFKKYFPSVDGTAIIGYPQNSPLKSIKLAISKQKKEDTTSGELLPSSMLGMVLKSPGTRGILNELTELAASKNFSIPLKALFNEQEDPHKAVMRKSIKLGHAPMLLSESQEKLMRSSAANPITLIVGPPGTGKTYTIGAVAIEHMSRGESVLIASQTDEAVDVISKKISESILTDLCVVRGGKKRVYATPLKRHLKSMLTNPLRQVRKTFDLPPKSDGDWLGKQIGVLSKKINQKNKSIAKLETSFIKEVENELHWGDMLKKINAGFWGELKTKFIAFRNKLQRPIWELSNDIYQQDQEQINDVIRLIRYTYAKQVIDALALQWKTINLFHEALKTRSDTERAKQFEKINFKAVLQTFPIWLTNLSEVKDVLPFKKELFDLVIIDEATQCDIASCLPLIQRAKRAVFAGDPHQLRHVSFLSINMQSNLRGKHQLMQLHAAKLNFRDHSVLDLAMNALNSQNQTAMLDEHYRSISPLISFSNKRFYDNELRIMTARPEEKEQGLYLIYCDGKKEQNGTNKKETEQLIWHIRTLIDSEKALSSEYASSAGILSPFRAQVDYIGKKVMEVFTVSEIKKHQIRVGTAHSFQGDERDRMYLSFVVDKDSHHAAFAHLNKEDVFNVAITRARSKQFVFHSVFERDLKDDSLLRSYLSQPSFKVANPNPTKKSVDLFLNEVCRQLKKWGIEDLWVGFEVAGLTIDLLIKVNDQFLGIDLVGYPGKYADSFGIERFRILNRAKIKTFPLPYSDWIFTYESAKKTLKEFVFNAASITPIEDGMSA